jgi:hypothetical protein
VRLEVVLVRPLPVRPEPDRHALRGAGDLDAAADEERRGVAAEALAQGGLACGSTAMVRFRWSR